MEILRDIKTKKLLAIGGSVPDPVFGQEVIKTKIDFIPDDFTHDDHHTQYDHDESSDRLVKKTTAQIEASDDYKIAQTIKADEEKEKKIQEKIREMAIKELKKQSGE